MPRLEEIGFNWDKFLTKPGESSVTDTRYVEYVLNISNGKPIIPLLLADSIPLLQCKWIYYYADCDCIDCITVIIPICREYEFREYLSESRNPELIPENIKLTIQEVNYRDRSADLANMKGFYTDLLTKAKDNLDMDIVLDSASSQSLSSSFSNQTPPKQGWLISIVSPSYKPSALCTKSLATVFTDPELAIKHCHLVHYSVLNDHPVIAAESNWSVSNMTTNAKELQTMKPGTAIRFSCLEYGSRLARHKVTGNITCFALC
jgi:hypothetical protein